MNSGRYVDSNKTSPHKAKLGHSIFQNGYSTFLFSALSREDWTAGIQKAFSLHIYFSVFSGLTLFRTGLYLYDLIQSRNKNLGKVVSFLREIVSATIVSLTLIGGLLASTAIAALSPWLFVGSMVINVMYNLSIGIHNTYQFLTAKDKQSQELYKASCKKHLIGAFFGSVAVLCFSMIMIFKIVPVAMSIFSACLSAYGFIKGVQGAVQMYKADKKVLNEVNKREHRVTASTDEEKHIPTISLKLDVASYPDENLEIETNPLTITSQNNDDYYFYRKNRAEKVSMVDSSNKYLIAEIDTKLLNLQQQLFRDSHKFFSEKNKRTIKVNALCKLKLLILDSSKTEDDFYALMRAPEFNSFFNNPFQSFFRQKSDTQDIFEAAEVYFNNLDSLQVVAGVRKSNI